MDSYFYAIHNKSRVICADCLPLVAINYTQKSIKMRSDLGINSRILSTSTDSATSTEGDPSSSSDDDLSSRLDVFQHQEPEQDGMPQTSYSSTTSTQSWKTKYGFTPLSAAVSILMNAMISTEKEKMT